MKIISKHKDYYDGVSSMYGIDDTYTYVRSLEKIYTKSLPENQKKKLKKMGFNWDIIQGRGNFYGLISDLKTLNLGGVWFLDEWYPFVERDGKYFYSIEELKKEKELEEKIKTKNILSFNGLKDILWLENKRVIQYNKIEPVQIKFDYKVPYLIFKKGIIELNGVLKDYEFYKVKDVWTCYQEIDMYISNQLAPRDEVSVNISDDLKAHSHGFNKYSFRKEKEK
jgi:hypothetical protein